MKNRSSGVDGITVLVAVLLAAIFIVFTFTVEPKLALVEIIAFVALAVIAVCRLSSAGARYRRFLERVTKNLDYTDQNVLSTFPIPVAVCDSEGYIKWCSSRFVRDISGNELSENERCESYTNGIPIADIISNEMVSVQLGEKFYSVYTMTYSQENKEFCVLYYIENTELKKTEIEYNLSRPYVVLLELDNLDDSRSDYRDSEKAEIKSRIEALLDDWVDSFNGIMKRMGDDRYVIITEKRCVSKMIKEEFSILKAVREFIYKDKLVGVTLSVGVAGGENMKVCEKNARKALEMALGRGGDQVAIKTKDSYDFIGGISKSAEKRNKVRSRIIGASLSELIKTSSNVIIMGHAYTDLDALGSAVGLACAVRSFGVPVYIATDREKSLAGALIDKLEHDYMGDLIISGERAMELLNKKSLVILVDTHIESFAEFPKLFEKASTRVIIDHHRRAASEIQNAVIFHHDPNASSVSEMVTELLQYMTPDMEITKTVAEALLAGIMLDTKSFVIRAGVRTFEAAAFLKDRGADTVSVKKLFSNSMEFYKQRSSVISSAENYKNCAVSTVDFTGGDVRVIAAQAADELLNVSDVKASFVIYENNGTVNISARSLGEINVQLIMEALGGGGHQTMAACQLSERDIHSAQTMLYSAIDKFFEKNSK